ncbi:hypothetical protein N7504_003306 [Penicillium tannophilum]|nr:hypothetical protein N7504_003306 [Penicillium tannophilum]
MPSVFVQSTLPEHHKHVAGGDASSSAQKRMRESNLVRGGGLFGGSPVSPMISGTMTVARRWGGPWDAHGLKIAA